MLLHNGLICTPLKKLNQAIVARMLCYNVLFECILNCIKLCKPIEFTSTTKPYISCYAIWIFLSFQISIRALIRVVLIQLQYAPFLTSRPIGGRLVTKIWLGPGWSVYTLHTSFLIYRPSILNSYYSYRPKPQQVNTVDPEQQSHNTYLNFGDESIESIESQTEHVMWHAIKRCQAFQIICTLISSDWWYFCHVLKYTYILLKL